MAMKTFLTKLYSWICTLLPRPKYISVANRSLTCSSVGCHTAGPSTVDGHHRDSVECVTGQSSEGVGVQ